MPKSTGSRPDHDARTARPQRTTWTLDRLRHERSVAIGFVLEPATRSAYRTHLKSYADFCNRHNLPLEPSPDTLSLYVTYESHYIDPKSVKTYLSGVCNALESAYPGVRTARTSPLVRNTLAGRLKMCVREVSRKTPLSAADVKSMIDKYEHGSFDDLLFVTILATGFNSLNRLGELVWPDSSALQDVRKCISITSLTFGDDVEAGVAFFSYWLPGHKGNRFFEGNTCLITARYDGACAVPLMRHYTHRRSTNALTCLRGELFLREDGTVPTRSWFLRYLRANFTSDYAGHSVRSGGATDLTLRGVPDQVIQKMGRWASDTFQIYIRKNPALLAAIAHLHPRAPSCSSFFFSHLSLRAAPLASLSLAPLPQLLAIIAFSLVTHNTHGRTRRGPVPPATLQHLRSTLSTRCPLVTV